MAEMRTTWAKPTTQSSRPIEIGPLLWLRAQYEFHNFSYRDPRSAFSAAVALPIISPTAVLLGICSTLYESGQQPEAEAFLRTIHRCAVKVDPPDGVIFFRAFHQLRRYVTTQNKGKGLKTNIGFTEINQGTREYGLPHGPLTVYVGVPESQRDFVAVALRDRSHIGTHDSLCSLIGSVEVVAEPKGVLYDPLGEGPVSFEGPVTVVTLSRFVSAEFSDSPAPWRMAGGTNTELLPFLIPGKFVGTRAGKIYRKRD
jgi:hypothetical protein